MMKRVFVAAALIAIASALGQAAGDVVAVNGGRLRGTSADGVRVFKGIPFAAPPVGARRWKEPEPVVAWSGVKNADTFGPQCMQEPYPAGSPYASSSPAAAMSEDCLYLNVWTAAKAGDKRPVMVWIHGGAWTRGSGSTPTYNGAALAKKGVVVVTTNYRLGVFGFLAHPELTKESPNHASGNYAILDHIAALQWVQKNIAAFGGDPTRVTIFGESAGSWSVNVLHASPLAKGLFHRAIGESGGQFSGNPSLTVAENRGVAVATAVGAKALAELRAVAADKLLRVDTFRSSANADGYVLPEDVVTTFGRHRENAVPVLIGSNANEMTTLTDASTFPTEMLEFRRQMSVRFPGFLDKFQIAYPVKSEADIKDALLQVGRDQTFTLEMRTWARMVAGEGSKAFLYQFTHVPPSPNAKTWGAYHASEIAYVFGTLRNRDWPYTSADFKLSDEMSSYWVNFAASGDPNGKGLPEWKPYDEKDEAYQELGDTVVTKHHLLKPQLDFLEQALRKRRTTSSPR
jgi:para-nitrobenzyl esterase